MPANGQPRFDVCWRRATDLVAILEELLGNLNEFSDFVRHFWSVWIIEGNKRRFRRGSLVNKAGSGLLSFVSSVTPKPAQRALQPRF